MPTLYLIPTTLGETSFNRILPSYNSEIISKLKYFVVEDIRSARRFLKQCDSKINIDHLTFFVLNQHTSTGELNTFLKPMKEGNDMGIISEAGCPAIADPGADVVALAQRENFTVVPLVGPSSILLALMASGFNGQSFAFNGYLPVQPSERIKAIRHIESKAIAYNQSQIFIETPYRNMKMFEDLIQTCNPNTLLCVAADITLPTEFIKTRTIKNWKNNKPELNKRPCIFIIYKS